LSGIVLEYCCNGDMFDFIKKSKNFPEPITKFFFHQLINALDHIHCAGYCHRDLKLENILLDNDFNIKIADFSFVKELDG